MPESVKITIALGFNGASGLFYEKIKPEALDYDAEILAVLSDLDQGGVLVTETSPEVLREAMVLETEITEA